MLPMPPEKQALLEHHLTESARLMREYTEPEKLKDFESIEVEVRNQVIEVVAPTIGEFFSQKEEKKTPGRSEKSKAWSEK